MRKTSKPLANKSAQKKPAAVKTAAKKPGAKTPAVKKSAAKPKRKAESHSDELVAIMTRVADGQTKLDEQVRRLIGITNKLVEAVGHLSEGVESVLQASEGSSPAQEGEPANEPQIEAPGEVVGVMVVDEAENGDGEGEDE
jgi:predicted  nucleic acid-binding Zn-ribbon protein